MQTELDACEEICLLLDEKGSRKVVIMAIINIANSLRGCFGHCLSLEKLKASTNSSSHSNLMMYIPEMPGLETTNQPQDKGKNKDNGNGNDNHSIPR
jgi:hypothetical protein